MDSGSGPPRRGPVGSALLGSGALSEVPLVLGLAVAALMGAAVTRGRVCDVDVPRPAAWEGPMAVCAGPGVDREALDRAVAWWRKLGHSVFVGCGTDHTVTIETDRTLGTLGLTRVAARGGEVETAHVRVRRPAWDLVLAHELGHALGYLHPRNAPSGHMMHPSRPGWDDRGLHAVP